MWGAGSLNYSCVVGWEDSVVGKCSVLYFLVVATLRIRVRGSTLTSFILHEFSDCLFILYQSL